MTSPSPQVPMFKTGVVGLLGLLGLSSVAVAASWSDFSEAFPALPCSDGWAACIVGDTVVSPGMVLDAGERPHPGDMRVGFFDLDPLAGFSPFVSLSPYSEEAVAAAPPPKPRTGGGGGSSSRPDRGGGTGSASDDGGSTGVGSGDAVADAGTVDQPAEEFPNTAGIDPIEEGAGVEPSATDDSTSLNPNRVDPANIVLAEGGGTAQPEPTEEVTPAPATATDPGEPEVVVADASVPEVEVAPPPPAAPKGCDDLVALEAPAMMGQLGPDRRKCLESAIGPSSQTTKNKISRVLIVNAEASGDRKEWERLMKRHLEKIDRSDPDLCFKYAIHLSRGGAGRASGVIRWADYALENKQQWSGNTYKKRVYALYKLRAQASNKLWQAAEKKYVEDRNDENEAKVGRYRGTTKDYSREWLDYARASGQDQKSPLALCVSASGSTEFCSG